MTLNINRWLSPEVNHALPLRFLEALLVVLKIFWTLTLFKGLSPDFAFNIKQI